MLHLNEEQYRASLPCGGVSLVLAGAGTGKTSTLVAKVTNVVREMRVDPGHILILSFSRKAADELHERACHDASGSCFRIRAETFHSFCLGLLREFEGLFLSRSGYAVFPAVIDEDERRRAMCDLIYADLSRFLGLPAGMVYDLIRRSDRLDAMTATKLERSGLSGELGAVKARFAEFKREKNLIDFDDIIECALALIDVSPALRLSVQARYRYIFVDEFQDVSDDNFRLLKCLLPDKGGNLFAVGDDWQAIYGFRNARVGYTVNIQRYFPEAMIHRLTLNYRSRKEILSLSEKLIRRNRFRTRKRLVARRGGGGVVGFHVVGSMEQEAEVIAGILAREDPDAGLAVLYRNNWQGVFLHGKIMLDENLGSIHFMTMHASKGLEFDTVVIAGISDDIIPDPENDVEEERRLLYVACTRARERLHLIAHLNAEGGMSRFGEELGMKGK